MSSEDLIEIDGRLTPKVADDSCTNNLTLTNALLKNSTFYTLIVKICKTNALMDWRERMRVSKTFYNVDYRHFRTPSVSHARSKCGYSDDRQTLIPFWYVTSELGQPNFVCDFQCIKSKIHVEDTKCTIKCAWVVSVSGSMNWHGLLTLEYNFVMSPCKTINKCRQIVDLLSFASLTRLASAYS